MSEGIYNFIAEESDRLEKQIKDGAEKIKELQDFLNQSYAKEAVLKAEIEQLEKETAHPHPDIWQDIARDAGWRDCGTCEEIKPYRGE